MNATSKTIIDRLVKMKSLASDGVGGERETASRLLAKIAAKYHIDLDAIDDAEEEESLHPLDIPRGWKLDLFIQLMALMRLEKYGTQKAIGHCTVIRNYKLRKGRHHIESHSAKCTMAQFIELQSKFAVLSHDFDRQRKSLFRAFLLANDLLLPYTPDSKPQTDEEKAICEEAWNLSRGIEKTILSKQLPNPMSRGEP